MQPDQWHPMVPREIITFLPGETTSFRPADYPWLVAMRLYLKGGDASQGTAVLGLAGT